MNDFKHISEILDELMIKIMDCSHKNPPPTAGRVKNEARCIKDINSEN